MGVLTFLYCLGALVIYVIFINPELPFAKWIIIAVSSSSLLIWELMFVLFIHFSVCFVSKLTRVNLNWYWIFLYDTLCFACLQ